MCNGIIIYVFQYCIVDMIYKRLAREYVRMKTEKQSWNVDTYILADVENAFFFI